MKTIFFPLVIFLMLLGRPVLADDLSDVEELIKKNLDTIVAVLQDEELGSEARDGKIIGIVNPIFDFPLMAKLTLGKKYWPGLSKEKKKEFTDLFIKRFRESYLEKLDLYSDETVVYGSPKRVKKKIHMPTQLTSKDTKISMLYKLYKSKNGWKIYDFEIQGVSLIQTYRSQFDGVLQDGTIDDLLEKFGGPGALFIPTGNP